MNRITKDVAEVVTKELLKDKRNEVNELKKQLHKTCRDYYLEQLPKDVINLFSKFRDYFRTTTSIRINGPGLPVGYKYYQLGESLPQSFDNISVNEKQAEVIIRLESKIADKEKALSKLTADIESALYNLRTYKNVEKEFPEAFKLLPEKPITTLAVNISDLRSQLN